jgi:hypothetical protein
LCVCWLQQKPHGFCFLQIAKNAANSNSVRMTWGIGESSGLMNSISNIPRYVEEWVLQSPFAWL